MFTQDYLLQSILVRGEVSNCKYHSSGHIYFTLKDESGALSCVMFAGNRRGLTYRMQEGDQVIAAGAVDVYPRDGRYQLYVSRIIRDGVGALNERYERLKKKLEEQGLFDEAYKQPIPAYIRTLGVVTAPTGAAVRDILNISLRRNPYLQIILYPALVQGDGAAQSIVNGIRALEARGVDVIIIGRGGGSLEDLWAFNEEVVAQAVFDCSVPVISAVGHETDTVITDYVADLRAPTPSAAAELAVFDYRRFAETLESYRGALTQAMRRRLSELRARADGARSALYHASPVYKLREQRLYAAQCEERLTGLMERALTQARRGGGRHGFLAIGAEALAERLDKRMERSLTQSRHRLELTAGRLHALSPLQKLSGGYGYIEKDGRGVRSAAQVSLGDSLCLYLQDGKIRAQAAEVEYTGKTLAGE